MVGTEPGGEEQDSKRGTMNREVILTISGRHKGAVAEKPEGDSVDTVTEAEYFLKNGTHYVIFEEKDENFSGVTKSKIKLQGKKLEMIRRGILSTHMILEEGKKHETGYQTPYGYMHLGMDTRSLLVEEWPKKIRILSEYILEAEGEYLSDCSLEITIQNKVKD